MKVKEESEKAGLKLNIQKAKIIASGPINSWQIDGEIVEIVADFILGAPKSLQMVTAAMKQKDAYSFEGKLWPTFYQDFLVAQMVKRLSTMWEAWVQPLGWEDSLEMEMATHSSTLG